VTDMSNLDSLTGEQREAAKSFFNAYDGSGSHLKRRDIHVGSLVFSEPAYQQKLPVDHSKPIEIHEEHLEALYKAKHPRFKNNLSNQAKRKNLELGHCIVFLVAVPDINVLKSIFAGLNK
jgi:hypothetical protein